jgi:hypothetical protein
MAKNKFKNRIAFCVWINDIRDEPIIDSWPSIIIDKRTMEDYKSMILHLKESGYNALDVFGLLTNRDWPMDIESVLSRERKKLVDTMIDFAHKEEIKIIYGLGNFSWGFDQIIKNDPEVRGTNPSAMCGSKPKSKVWQKKVIDFVVNNFDIDGFHLEVADLGRCRCSECVKENNVQYYNRLNRETALYIRENWPKNILLVNTSGYMPWGDFVGKKDYPSVYDLGRHIDIFIDGGNHGLFIKEEERPKFIAGFDCEYGTSGGFWVYPPQRWGRLRWFLPYIQTQHEHLRQLFKDGSRSCELYLGPAANPSTEINIMCNGLLLLDVDRATNDILEESIDRLYGPKNNRACEELAELFMKAEDAFFNNWNPYRIVNIPEKYKDGIDAIFEWSKENRERAIPGELFLEPLLGDSPGFPAYLAVQMTNEGRTHYKGELQAIFHSLTKMKNDFNDSGRLIRIKECINGVTRDIDAVNGIDELNN